MDASAFFQSKDTYLNATHVAAGDLDVTIKSWDVELVGKEKKLVIYFDELTRGLALNKTNYESLLEAFGPETDDWIGRPITLYATKTTFDDKEVDAVRIRIDRADYLSREQWSTPKPLPDLGDDIPY